MPNERISLGYSLRSEEASEANRFPADQRLVDEIHSPVCADPNVWVEPYEIERLFAGRLPAFANPLGLSKSLNELIEACEERGLRASGLSPVCLTAYSTNVLALIEHYGPGYFEQGKSEDDLLRSGWQFVGFDVVDLRGLISGLKGCGYTEPSRSRLRESFGAELNVLGLFKGTFAADRFAELRGIEIKEHAPFTVLGVLRNRIL